MGERYHPKLSKHGTTSGIHDKHGAGGVLSMKQQQLPMPVGARAATIAHLLAGPLFMLSLGMTKFALERHLILDFCRELQAADCADPRVTTAAAAWLRWVLTAETMCAIFTLPIFGAISDALKLARPTTPTSRVPLLTWQLGLLPLVPMTYLCQALFGLPRWVQLFGPVSASLLGAQINVFMPTWFCVRADLFQAEAQVMATTHVHKGGAFLRMETALISSNVVAGLVQQAVLTSAPSSEIEALHRMYALAVLCQVLSCALVTSIALCASRPAVSDAASLESKASPRPLCELVALRSFAHLWSMVLAAAREATSGQRRFASQLLLVFALSNSTSGMSSVLTVLLSGQGWGAAGISRRAALEGAGQLCQVLFAGRVLQWSGSVETIVALLAAASMSGWAALAVGVVARSRMVQWGSALLTGGWGPTIVMTRSVVVLYCDEARLGSVLAFLALVDEAVTALGDFVYATLLSLTAARAPSADAWLAAFAMAVCAYAGRCMAASDAMHGQVGAGDEKPSPSKRELV